jgi:hypothetical protein
VSTRWIVEPLNVIEHIGACAMLTPRFVLNFTAANSRLNILLVM